MASCRADRQTDGAEFSAAARLHMASGEGRHAHLQHGAVLEAEALLEQAGDVGHVHAQEGADGAVFGHFVAH